MKKSLVALVMFTMLVGNTFAKEINLNCVHRDLVKSIYLDTTNMNATLGICPDCTKTSHELFSDANTYWFTSVIDTTIWWVMQYQIDRNDISLTIVTTIGDSKDREYGQCSIVEKSTLI